MELIIKIQYNPAEKSAVKFIKDVKNLNTFDKEIKIISDVNVSRELLMDFIENKVCKYFNLTPKQLNSNTHKRETVQARQIAMYFSKEITKHSLSVIGLRFAGRDHATVLHACKTVNNLIDTDKAFRHQIEEIRKQLK
jgi:chromosomal replication initiator protein